MEPYDVHCETCHARLRVSQQRFVGEIHPCPKCGSMVLIAVPVIAADGAADATQLAAAGQAAAGVGLAARLAGVVGRHAVVWSACGAVLVVVGSLAVSLLADGDEQVAARADQLATSADPAIESGLDGESIVEHASPPPATDVRMDETRYGSMPGAADAAATPELPVVLPSLPALPKDDDARSSESSEAVAASDRPAKSTPAETADDVGASDNAAAAGKTLRLDPLGFQPSRANLGNLSGRASTDAAGGYSAELDEELPDVSAKPPAADPPRRAAEPIDVAAQLSVRLESIDVPTMALADFLRMASDMAAVPIKLDPAAGVSPQAKVTVRGHEVTLGELLDDVLAQHGLARENRVGCIILIRQEPD